MVSLCVRMSITIVGAVLLRPSAIVVTSIPTWPTKNCHLFLAVNFDLKRGDEALVSPVGFAFSSPLCFSSFFSVSIAFLEYARN